MEDQFEVLNSTMKDIPMIFQLFDYSIGYQEKHGYPVWRNYDKNVIVKDIEDRNQYKVVVDAQIGIVFSVCYSDQIIWRSYEKGDSVYLHRMVVNPAFKGQKLFGTVVNWAVEHCHRKGLRNIRMDTWASNPTLISYYKGYGFDVIENFTTPDAAELPVHNRNLPLTLLGYGVG